MEPEYVTAVILTWYKRPRSTSSTWNQMCLSESTTKSSPSTMLVASMMTSTHIWGLRLSSSLGSKNIKKLKKLALKPKNSPFFLPFNHLNHSNLASESEILGEDGPWEKSQVQHLLDPLWSQWWLLLPSLDLEMFKASRYTASNFNLSQRKERMTKSS